jgi:hypothetical protein
VLVHILNKSTDALTGATIEINPTNIGLVGGSMSYTAFNPDALRPQAGRPLPAATRSRSICPLTIILVWLDGTEA